jgi:hypothetical protein
VSGYTGLIIVLLLVVVVVVIVVVVVVVVIIVVHVGFVLTSVSLDTVGSCAYFFKIVLRDRKKITPGTRPAGDVYCI